MAGDQGLVSDGGSAIAPVIASRWVGYRSTSNPCGAGDESDVEVLLLVGSGETPRGSRRRADEFIPYRTPNGEIRITVSVFNE